MLALIFQKRNTMSKSKDHMLSQSLSMKMRVDSVQGIKDDGKRKLPLLEKPQKKFVTGSYFPAPKADSIYERLSGSYQFDSNMGVMQDRHPIIHPSTLCVRCSETACMCMACTEILCNNAVTFFRRSRAKGAAELFATAIKQAGMAKATKLMIFRLWKHGFQLRQRQDMKMRRVVERMFGNSCLFTPFKAWQKYTKDNMLHRKDKKMQEMAARIAQLEYQVRDVTKQKEAQVAKVVLLQKQVADTEANFADNQAFIKVLHKKIADERVRVIGLATLVEHLMKSTETCHDVWKKDLSYVGSQLLIASTSVAAHDYREFCSEADRQQIIKTRLARADRFHATSAVYSEQLEAEEQFSTSMLLRWVDHTSKRISKFSQSGVNVDEYLPKFETTENFPALLDGKQLTRAVVCLIYDSMDSSNTLGDNYSAFGGSLDLGDSDRVGFGRTQLEEILGCQNSPFFLLAGSIGYAAKYLNVPPFDVHHIRVDNQILKSFVTFLMVNSAPAMIPSEQDDIDNYTHLYESTQGALHNLVNDYEDLELLKAVQTSCAKIVGTHLVEEVASPGSVEGLDSPGSLTHEDADCTLGDFVDVMTEENKEQATDTIVEDDEPDSKFAFEKEIIKTVYPPETVGHCYDKLGEAVNALLGSEEYPHCVTNVITRGLATNAIVNDLRNKVQLVANQKISGTRLATDVQSHLIAGHTEALLRKLKLLCDKVDAIPEVAPFEFK